MDVSENIISDAKERLSEVIASIRQEILELENTIDRVSSSIGTWYKDGDAESAKATIIGARSTIENHRELLHSPYFSKLTLENFPQQEVLISKYTFPKKGIYSWVAPVAKLRFKELGQVDYQLLNDEEITINIVDKQKIKIREGELKELHIENENGKNTLLTDEAIEHKQFGLTDIIEKMEAYQDELIRIKPDGSILIAGSAGSGKTTLALHKVAYLALAPETHLEYRPVKMIVFVQDEGTKSYFDTVLPSLGIDLVEITTFPKWAKDKMNIKENYQDQIFNELSQNLILDNAKRKVIKNVDFTDKKESIWDTLRDIYIRSFDFDEYMLFQEQKSRGVIDRFDLTILMNMYLQVENVTNVDKYSLIAIDEAENYLPEQINIIKNSYLKRLNQ